MLRAEHLLLDRYAAQIELFSFRRAVLVREHDGQAAEYTRDLAALGTLRLFQDRQGLSERLLGPLQLVDGPQEIAEGLQGEPHPPVGVTERLQPDGQRPLQCRPRLRILALSLLDPCEDDEAISDSRGFRSQGLATARSVLPNRLAS